MYLCQTHYLLPLFLLLQDESLSVSTVSLQLLGRLAEYNPGPILPPLRRFLMEIISELICGSDHLGGRECATRLLIVFLRAQTLQRLISPFFPAIIQTLPFQGVAPRLASAALEAIGELSQVSGSEMANSHQIHQIIPHILETLQDQSSTSKQRISLASLGQMAGCMGYVIQPFIDYPQLLPLAAYLLPTTKREPWSLRREVIRLFGILGALEPNRYHTVAPKVRKGGGVGIGYFIKVEDKEDISDKNNNNIIARSSYVMSSTLPIKIINKKNVSEKLINELSKIKDALLPISDSAATLPSPLFSEYSSSSLDEKNDDNEPAHIYMYEQYAMMAQPVSKHVLPRRLAPSSEDFAVQALTRILKDPSLSVHHGMVMQAIMFIFNALGLRCVPFLKRIVPHILQKVQICNQSSLREALLQQLAIFLSFFLIY